MSEYSGPLGDCGSEQRVRQLPLPTLLFLSGLLGFGDPVCGGDHGIPQSVVPKDVFERSKRGGLPGVVIVGQRVKEDDARGEVAVLVPGYRV